MSLVSGASHGRKDHWIGRVLGDILGLSTSLLCLVHCLALPVLAVLFPVLSGGLDLGLWAHLIFIGLALLASLLAFRQYPNQGGRNFRVRCLLATGFVSLIIGASLHDSPIADGETPVTLLGATLLAGAHWHNIRSRFRQAAKPASALVKA